MLFRQIIDPGLAQYAYLVGCQKTNQALIIDPERDIDRYVALAEGEGLDIVAVAETHIHADFLSGAREFADRYGTRLYLSDEGSDDWKYEWVKSGAYETVLLKGGDTFHIGNVELKALHTPGHTPEHLSFLVTDRGGGVHEPMGIVTGDFVFVGDFGRPDLLERAARIDHMMEPSARRLYHSAQTFLDLPDYLQVWPGHGAGSACGKALGAVPETTVGYERRFSPAVDAVRKGEDAFVEYILEDQPDPPLYFARMKQQNRDGVPLLGDLPRPQKLTVDRLAKAVAADDAIILDTRAEQEAFAAGHIPGALHAPLASSFNSFVGSLVEDAGTRLFLLVDEHDVEEAVRRLVRMGYDTIVGFADLAAMSDYFDGGGAIATIDVIDFEAVDRQRTDPNVDVYDVRYTSEFLEGHIPGALHVPYTRLPEREDEIPTDRTLLVHCGSGIRSTAAAAYLARKGRNVKVVIDEWHDYAALHRTQRETPAESR